MKNKDNKIANVAREIMYYKNICKVIKIQTLTV